jgi:hypothetical protein
MHIATTLVQFTVAMACNSSDAAGLKGCSIGILQMPLLLVGFGRAHQDSFN